MQNNVLLGNKGIFLFHVAMINTWLKYLIFKRSKSIHLKKDNPSLLFGIFIL